MKRQSTGDYPRRCAQCKRVEDEGEQFKLRSWIEQWGDEMGDAPVRVEAYICMDCEAVNWATEGADAADKLERVLALTLEIADFRKRNLAATCPCGDGQPCTHGAEGDPITQSCAKILLVAGGLRV